MIVDDDQRLVEQALRGDTKAFESLVEKYQKLVFNLAYKMSRDYDDSADITQTVFLKVFEKLKSFDTKYKFFSWLYRIAVNESLNAVQKRVPSERFNEETVVSQDTPYDSIDSEDASQRVQEALLELDLNYRVVIVLRHFQDLSYEEISQILDIPEKKVKSRLFSGRTMLRTICQRRGIA
jgi:RNA polymerase sigma-70 factor (ECF subfamily)